MMNNNLLNKKQLIGCPQPISDFEQLYKRYVDHVYEKCLHMTCDTDQDIPAEPLQTYSPGSTISGIGQLPHANPIAFSTISVPANR